MPILTLPREKKTKDKRQKTKDKRQKTKDRKETKIYKNRINIEN